MTEDSTMPGIVVLWYGSRLSKEQLLSLNISLWKSLPFTGASFLKTQPIRDPQANCFGSKEEGGTIFM